MAALFYIITKVDILHAFNFHRFASSAEMVKNNCIWNFLVLQYLFNLYGLSKHLKLYIDATTVTIKLEIWAKLYFNEITIHN